MNDSSKDLKYYMNLPYEIEVTPDICGIEPCFVASVPELYGCMAQGHTPKEALQELRIAREDYFRALLAKHLDIPEPHVVRYASQQSASSYTPRATPISYLSSSGTSGEVYNASWTIVQNGETNVVALTLVDYKLEPIGARSNKPASPMSLTTTRILPPAVTFSE